MTDAGEVVRCALIAALKGRSELAGVAGWGSDVSSGSLPQAIVEEPVSGDWGTKTPRGRELRTMVRVRVSKGQAMRLPSITSGVEAAGEGLKGDLGGWGVASAVLVRSRVAQNSDGTRSALIEHRIRVLEN